VVLEGLFVDKLGDPKFNDVLQKMLEKICETVLPKFVISQLISKLSKDAKKSNPKTNQELVKQINNIIDLCTVKFIPLKDTIAFSKELLGNNNNLLR